MLSTQLLINNSETATKKYVTLDHSETKILDDDDNDDKNDDDDDEAVSNKIEVLYHNRQVEHADVHLSYKSFQQQKNNKPTNQKLKYQIFFELFECYDGFTNQGCSIAVCIGVRRS